MIRKKTFLFPHSIIMGNTKKRIPATLMPITICKPWYMEIKEEEKDLTVLFPEEKLKPPRDLLKLLEEYKLWMRVQDKGNVLFMIMEKEIWGQDESSKKIKDLIRSGKIDNDEINEKLYKNIRWHLILHLASDFEQSQLEIDEKIKKLNKGSSPLRDLIESPPMSMELMFKDVATSNIEPILDERVLYEIIMAWIGLFKNHIPEDAILLTLNKSIFEYIKSIFEDALTKDISKKEEIPIKEEINDGVSLLKLSFPVLIEDREEIRNFISNKTLIYPKDI